MAALRSLVQEAFLRGAAGSSRCCRSCQTTPSPTPWSCRSSLPLRWACCAHTLSIYYRFARLVVRSPAHLVAPALHIRKGPLQSACLGGLACFVRGHIEGYRNLQFVSLKDTATRCDHSKVVGSESVLDAQMLQAGEGTGGMPRSYSTPRLSLQYRSPGIIQFSGGMAAPPPLMGQQHWMVSLQNIVCATRQTTDVVCVKIVSRSSCSSFFYLWDVPGTCSHCLCLRGRSARLPPAKA